MKRFIVLVLSLSLLTGCASLPGEERAFAVCLGIQHEGQVWQVAARVPSYKQDGGYLTLIGQGASLAGAMAAADASSPMRLHLGQLRLLTFTRATAESEDFPGVLEALSRWPDMRLRAFMTVTSAQLTDLMNALSPRTGTRLSKDIETLMSSRMEQGVAVPATLADWMRSGERQSLALTDVYLTQAEEAEGTVMTHAPGSSEETGVVQLAGCWLFSQAGRLRGGLTPSQTQTLSLLRGQFAKGVLLLGDEAVTLSDASTQVRYYASGVVRCDTSFTVQSAAGTEQFASQKMSETIREVVSLLQMADCDALGLARQAVMTCADMDSWHGLDWQSRYARLQWTVSAVAEAAA